MNLKVPKWGVTLFAFAMLVLQSQASKTNSGNASDPYEAALVQYVNSYNLRKASGDTLRMMLKPQMVDSGRMTSAKFDEMIDEITDSLVPEMEKEVKDCVRKNLSLEELRQINAFNASPVGKKMSGLLPKFMETGNQVATRPEMQAKIQTVVLKHLKVKGQK